MAEQGNIEIKIGSEKSFGVVFSIVFGLVTLYLYFQASDYAIWTLAISIVFLALAFIAPQTLRVPNVLWFKLGMLIGSVVAPIVMALVFFLTVVPIGLIFKLTRKDLINQKLDKSVKSYWITRDTPVRTMKDQF